MVLLKNCSHMMHMECAREKLHTAIDTRDFPIRCAVPECTAEVKMGDINSIVTPEYKQRYQDIKFKIYAEQNPGTFKHCPVQGCEYIFSPSIHDQSFYCRTCKKNMCIMCAEDPHDGMDCD